LSERRVYVVRRNQIIARASVKWRTEEGFCSEVGAREEKLVPYTCAVRKEEGRLVWDVRRRKEERRETPDDRGIV